MQSDDGLWYQLSVVSETLDINPVPVDPGTQAYRVLTNQTDGLKYKFQLFTESGTVGYEIEAAPTTAKETRTIFKTDDGNQELVLVNDGGLTVRLKDL